MSDLSPQSPSPVSTLRRLPTVDRNTTLPTDASASAEAPPRSPSLAFQKTPNDSLAPLNLPSQTTQTDSIETAMGRSFLAASNVQDLQHLVDQQTSAIKLLHDAFAAERQVWSLEREDLYRRIANLEQLLKNADGYSPAKSPLLSPQSTGSLASPQSRSTNQLHRLPSIAEDENIPPLSQRRDGAPMSIQIPRIQTDMESTTRREGSVSFAESTPASVKVETIPTSPTHALNPPSPLPLKYRVEAGHTPLKAPRPPTPPPQNSSSTDGVQDTPTRTNTHINAFLTQDSERDEDEGLKGPLSMPELPAHPTEANFTLEMLSKRLHQIEKHPEQHTSKPFVFTQPSPGLASPVAEANVTDHEGTLKSSEAVKSPVNTHIAASKDRSNLVSHRASPSASDVSPKTEPTSKHVLLEDKVQQAFEQGGIRLKKKTSVNFGAPLGQLGGYGSVRKLS